VNRYPIPEKEARTEIIVINSRFICSGAPAFTVEQAKSFIGKIRAEFPDASHHVPAYLIGFGSSVIAHCSDAGEPPGTAGRPVLSVLQGSKLGDVAVVVTRYFGGTKLGTGGLVHAYADAVKALLEILPRAEKVATYSVMLAFQYTYFERISLLILTHKGVMLGEEFGSDVTVSARFPVDYFDHFQKALIELTRGQVTAEILETNLDTIMPINKGTTD
jgi:uncharacterized YigZ family protein